QGIPLMEAYKKTFRGGPADRSAPDPRKWRLTVPKSGTSEPLVVDFLEPMDYVGLQKALSVSDGPTLVSGAGVISHDETRWSFTPRRPWQAGNYELLVKNSLEDLAANKVGQLFDTDLRDDPVNESVDVKTFTVPIHVQ